MLRENVACDAGANADVRVAKANSAASAEVFMVNNKINWSYNITVIESMTSLKDRRAAGVSLVSV